MRQQKKSRSPEKIRVGILGAGNIVKDVHLPVLSNMDDVRIVWISDVRAGQAETLARMYKTSAEVHPRIEDCPDTDIVLVAIPVGYRDEPMQFILKHGWSALCEKPFAASRAQHERYLTDASRNGVLVSVGLMRRYYRGHILAKSVIASGILGSVNWVSASQGDRMKRTGRADWYQGDRRAAGGGILVETGSHLIDQVLDILQVSAFDVEQCDLVLSGDIDTESRATAVLRTPLQSTPIPFRVQLSNINDLSRGIEFGFSNGSVKMGIFPGDPVVLFDNDRKPIAALQGNSGVSEIHAAFYAEWRDFIRQWKDPQYTSAISAETALQTTVFIEGCYAVGKALA